MKIGESVFGRLKSGDPFQGTVLNVEGNIIKVHVNRAVSSVKVGKEFNVSRKDVRLVSYIRYNKLTVHDVINIAICFSYKDLEKEAVGIYSTMPYYTEPTKKQLERFNNDLTKMIEKLKLRIQSEF